MTQPSANQFDLTKDLGGITPDQVNSFHDHDDVDSSSLSHHHRLGLSDTNASPGSHTHNGRDSRIIGGGQIPPIVAGSRGGNAALASLLTRLSALRIITDATTP